MVYENIKIIKKNKEINQESDEKILDQSEEDFKREYEDKNWKMDEHD